jgi:hypothetical protein
MAARLAVMAANALRNYDVDRALELLEQIRATCDPDFTATALRPSGSSRRRGWGEPPGGAGPLRSHGRPPDQARPIATTRFAHRSAAT